jgi:methyl-accepting chemotaxis protein
MEDLLMSGKLPERDNRRVAQSTGIETRAELERRFVIRLTRVLIPFFIVMPVLIFFLSLFSGQAPGFVVAGVACTELIASLVAYWLSSRRGLVRPASWLIVVYTLAFQIFISFMLDSSQPIPAFFIPTLLVGLFLLPWRGVFGLGLVATLAVAVLKVAEMNGYRAPLVLTNSYVVLGLWLAIILLPFLIASFLVNQLRGAFGRLLVKTGLLDEALREIEQKRLYSQTVGEQVNSVIVELNTTASQQASGSHQQAAALTESITSLEELAQTAREIARKSDNIDELTAEIVSMTREVEHTSREMAQSGEQGRGSVARTLNSNRQVSIHYHKLVQTLMNLKGFSIQIKGISEVLGELSGETHLLALNATIEAAGAGVYGERFGVVAGEVRNLANRSLSASREIKQVLGEVEDGISQAVEVARAGQRETDLAMQLSAESGQSIQALAEAVGSNSQEIEKISDRLQLMSELTQEINYATNQQFSASKQAVDILRQVGTVAQQSAAGSRQLTLTANNLESLSSGLKDALAA